MKDKSFAEPILLLVLFLMFVLARKVDSDRHKEVMAKLNAIESKITATSD